MKKIILSFVFLVFLPVGLFCFVSKINADNSIPYQVVNLESGWSIVSTPRILSGHEFSIAETSDNFDIYLLNRNSVSGWQTMQEAGQTEFQPLFAYFIHNKTSQVQTLKLKYNFDLSPAQRLFQRTLSVGWNTIGVASPDYALKNGATNTDTNNPKNILSSIINSVSQIIDFTADQTSLDSAKVGNTWATRVASEANNLNDFRELKGYGVFISEATDNYLGSQNINEGAVFSKSADNENFLYGNSQEKNLLTFQIDSLYDVKINSLTFVFSGTGDKNNISNFKLYDVANNALVGSLNAIDENNKLIFSNLGIDLQSGNKKIKLVGDRSSLISGETYTFSLESASLNHEINIAGLPISNTLTVAQTGTVTVSRATDSPSGNISASSTNVVLAKFKLKADGEDVKVSDLTLKIYGSIGAIGMYQTSIYYDGAQVGQTTTTMNSGANADATGGTTFSFGNTLVLPAGVEKVLEVRSDVKNATGGEIAAGKTLTAYIPSFTAIGKTSGASVTISSVTGYQLTVASCTLSVTKNQAVPNWTATVPIGVAGATNVLIGSFILTAGSGEGANIIGISAQIASTSVPGTANTEFQNVRIFKGTYASGVQLGSALNSGGTPTASTTYTVYPSLYLALAKAESVTLNVYADILTGADTNNIRQVVIGPVYGTGLITNTSIGSSGWVSGQNAVVSAGGYVGAAIDVGTPVASLVVAGSTGVEFAKWKLSASSSPEAMSITGLIATTTLTTATVSSVSNLVLSATIDGVASSWTGVTLTGLAANERADFGSLMTVNPLVIPAGKEAVVTLKADVASWPTAPSGGVVTFALASTTWKGEGDPTSVTVYAVGNAQTLYKSKPTVTLTAQPLPGGTFSDGTQTLIKFRIAADAKGAIDLQRVNIKVAVNDIATTTSNLSIQDISLYEVGDTTILNDRVSINATATAAYTDYSASSTVADSIFGGALTGDPLSKTGNILLTNNDGSALTQIGAGSYVDFEVKATIAGSAQYDTMTFSLDDLSAAEDNAIKWGDTITAVIPSTSVKTIPTNTWSYTR